MADNFFDVPFTEDTHIKLELYSDYLTEWIPVFLCAKKSFVKSINVFDFFAGAGRDSAGKPGSPILAIEAFMKYKEHLGRQDVTINLFLNDKDKSHCERLKANIEQLAFDKRNINVHYYNEDFLHAYAILKPKMANSANLIFLDQFGVKYVDKAMFQELIKLKITDILFFVSSSTFKRFSSDENISAILGYNLDDINKKPAAEIHRFVHQTYDSFIPKGYSYCIAPFSIKKGSNVYGLVFGSAHPLGIEKFLQICWEKDKLTGEANFDIEGSKIDETAPFLFSDLNTPKKIDVFRANLREMILTEQLKSDKDVFLFMLNSGFISIHVKPVIQELIGEKKISLKNPSFKSSTVWKKDRKPQLIKIL